MAYGLSHSLRMIFSKNTIKDAARLSMARWYNKVDESRMKQFNVIAATFYEHYDEILNFYNNRASNAAAESFNAKIKLFRASMPKSNYSGLTCMESWTKSFSCSESLSCMAIPTKFLLPHSSSILSPYFSP